MNAGTLSLWPSPCPTKKLVERALQAQNNQLDAQCVAQLNKPPHRLLRIGGFQQDERATRVTGLVGSCSHTMRVVGWVGILLDVIRGVESALREGGVLPRINKHWRRRVGRIEHLTGVYEG